MTEPAVRSALGAGSEPYEFDFGDEEVGAWLDEHLTADERAEYTRLADSLPSYRPPPLGRGQVARRLDFAWRSWRLRMWLRWRTRRRMATLYDLARERGGDPPGPSWKIKTEWGA